MDATKANAYRWLTAHVGQELTTWQRRPDGMVWRPGRRTLTQTGTRTWALDGSEVRITKDHVVLDVSDERLMLEWLDEDGTQIHVTSYRPVAEEEEF